jgi:polyhydroxyalkanoate synthesis repressor PhaR
MMPAMSEVRIIKRYANRKLYDTQHSRYVTLEQIAEMIREGDDVKIIDNKSKEDLTSVTLAQIIFEEEKKQKSFLPLQAMRNIIQSGGDSITQLVTQAQRRVNEILPHKRDDELEEVAPGEASAEVDAKPGPLAIREFREFVQTSQKTIDDWQKRIDGTIRNVVEGISPFAGLHSDVRSLQDRIAELESKLAAVVEADETSRGESLGEIAHKKSSDAGG